MKVKKMNSFSKFDFFITQIPIKTCSIHCSDKRCSHRSLPHPAEDILKAGLMRNLILFTIIEHGTYRIMGGQSGGASAPGVPELGVRQK